VVKEVDHMREFSSRTKRARVATSVAVALLAALSVGVLLWVQVARIEASGKQARERFEADIVEVLVASRDIAVGESIGASNTRSEQWLSSMLPEGAVPASSISSVAGERVSEKILSGEPVTKRRLGGAGKAPIAVAEGLSAVSISCDSVTALGGEIRAGMVVDVLGATGGSAVDVIVPSAQILSFSNAAQQQSKPDGVMGSFSEQQREVTWVTLAVPDGMVRQLVSVATNGVVHLVLPGSGSGASDG